MPDSVFVLIGMAGIILGLINIFRSRSGMSDEELVELEKQQYKEECHQYERECEEYERECERYRETCY